MFTFLLIVQTIVATALVGTILMQRSEGGGLGVGGSSSGFMTARGAADFLTRSTAVLGTIFVCLSIALAAIAGVSRQPVEIDTTLANQLESSQPAQPQPQPVPVQPADTAPVTGQQPQPAPAVPVAQ